MDAKPAFKRLAFLVHIPEMFNHYLAVWKILGADAFDIVLAGHNADIEASRVLARQYGYRAYHHGDVIRAGHRYDTAVSNHSFFHHQGQPLLHVLAHRRVRFMYALGKAQHNFSDWNDHFDMVLCFGPWQAERIGEQFNVATFQMGYPRYDDYFRHPELQGLYPDDLPLDKTKKTVLWLPTWRELSSISLFSDAMSHLCARYNVIAKTHPISANEEPGALKILEQYPFTAVITHVYDNLKLFRCADYIVSDYGGTAFGAIYLDKKLLLLNMPNAQQDSLTGEQSPDVLLREDIINVDHNQRWELASILEDEAIWEAQKKTRQRLRHRYFAPTYGFSAELAALALNNLETILRQG